MSGQLGFFHKFAGKDDDVDFYGAGELVRFDQFKIIARTLDAFVARPAVQRGLLVPAAPATP